MKYLCFLFVFCCSVSAFAGTDTTQTKIIKKQPLVFIAGFDEGDNAYYTNAKNYFQNQYCLVVEEAQSLAEILDWLRLHYDADLYDDIHIVSHSNPWRGLSMKVSRENDRITSETLEDAIHMQEIVPLSVNFLQKGTKIIFHSCGLGANTELLKDLKRAFTADENIPLFASEFFNVFGGKYAGHYLAKTYFGYYPTAHSPGPRALTMEFKKKYPTVKVDWETILKTRAEQLPGDMYTYRFNIPVEWEFEFEDKADIPNFKNTQEIINWISEDATLLSIIKAFRIPIEKFRWLSKVRGNTLYIKGKTTVLCVMQPIMKANATHEYSPVVVNGISYTKV
jgi:hypothetical protein